MPETQILIRLFVAAILGSAVGLERERLDWVAGLRTHMLVCVGSCLFMVVSAYGFGGVLGRPAVVLDPSRIAAQVVTGVGFLGAGTILLRGEIVRGLTTAASLWAVAAVGLAVGGGLYREAAVTTFLILLILAGVKQLETRFFSSRRPRTVHLNIDPATVSLAAIEAAAVAAGLSLAQILVRRGESPGEDRVQLLLGRAPRERVLALIEAVRVLPGVREATLPSP